MSQTRYLITGGAGFVGVNLCRYLLEKDAQVRSLDIVDFDYPDLIGKVEVVTGDIRDRATVERAMEGIDIVVHCAAALPLYPKEEIISTDLGGADNLLKSALNHGVSRFIYISSTAIYGIPRHAPIYEDDELEGVGTYGETKIKAEAECLEYREKGMCVPIIRPKTIVGPERLGVLAILYDWARRGKNVPIVGNGKNQYQLLDIEDLCQAIYLCATLPPDIVNDTFNIGAREFTTMKEDFGAVLEEAGYGKRIVPTPTALLIWTLKILEALRLSPLYKWVYETAPKDSVVSIEKARKVLGFEPKYSNKESLVRNYQWYLEHYTEYGSSGVTHRVPWKQGILALVRMFF